MADAWDQLGKSDKMANVTALQESFGAVANGRTQVLLLAWAVAPASKLEQEWGRDLGGRVDHDDD